MPYTILDYRIIYSTSKCSLDQRSSARFAFDQLLSFLSFQSFFSFFPLFSARGQQQQKKEKKKKKKGCDCRLVGSYSHFLWQVGYIYVYPFFYRDEDCLLLPVDWYQGTGILFLFAPRTVFNHSTGINTPPSPPRLSSSCCGGGEKGSDSFPKSSGMRGE